MGSAALVATMRLAIGQTPEARRVCWPLPWLPAPDRMKIPPIRPATDASPFEHELLLCLFRLGNKWFCVAFNRPKLGQLLLPLGGLFSLSRLLIKFHQMLNSHLTT